MENTIEPVDLNTASLESLQSLPGISLKAAQRIEAARPLTSFDDLEKIQGLRKKTLEALRPLVTVSSVGLAIREEEIPIEITPESVPHEMEVEMNPAEEESVSVEEDKMVDETEPGVVPVEAEEVLPESVSVEVDQPIREQESQPEGQELKVPPAPVPMTSPTEPTQKKYVTRETMLWTSAVCAVLAVILAVLATLGILGIVNGGLRFVRPAQLNAVSTQLERVDKTVSLLQEDMLDLQTRLAALEGLAEQVDRLEKTLASTAEKVDALDTEMQDLGATVTDLSSQTEALTTQVDDLTLQAENLRKDVDNLTSVVNELTNRTNIFQKFFDGLKDLVKVFDKP